MTTKKTQKYKLTLVAFLTLAVLIASGITFWRYSPLADEGDTICFNPVDFVFVLDNSESMWNDYTAPAGTPGRTLKIFEARNATRTILSQFEIRNQQIDARTDLTDTQKLQQKIRVGLVTFNGIAESDSPLTYTMSDVKARVTHLERDPLDAKHINTNIGHGVSVGHDTFDTNADRTSVKKVMILLSDGVANKYYDGNKLKEDPNSPHKKANNYFRAQAVEARNDTRFDPKLEIFSIGYGFAQGGSGITEATMQDRTVSGPSVSTTTNDHYFSNPSGTSLVNTMKEITDIACNNPPPPAAINVTLTADPESITKGATSTLDWTSTGDADRLELSSDKDGVINAAAAKPNGTLAVTPDATTIYTIKAFKEGLTPVSAQATVTVTEPNPDPDPTIGVNLSANPATIIKGDTSVLTWTSAGEPDRLELSSNKDGVINSNVTKPGGTMNVTPSSTTVYTITAVKTGLTSVSAQATVTVTELPPLDLTFQANPTTINQGESSNLTWSCTGNPDRILLSSNRDPAGSIPAVVANPSGSQAVTLNATTIFTMTCSREGATSVTKQATVTVIGSTPAPSGTPVAEITDITIPAGPPKTGGGFWASFTSFVADLFGF